MAARICKACEIKFPPDNVFKCRVCGGDTNWQPYVATDNDWEKKVAEALRPECEDFLATKEGRWRYERLLEAGYTDTQALFLAHDREVDTHRAVELGKKAGADLAFRILS